MSVCDTALYSILCLGLWGTGSGKGLCPFTAHSSTVSTPSMSTAQMSLMVFTQVDIWSNQKTHGKHSTSCCRSKTERGGVRQTQHDSDRGWAMGETDRQWGRICTVSVHATLREMKGRWKTETSYIFIQVGLLQVYHFKLDPLQNLFQRLACFVV